MEQQIKSAYSAHDSEIYSKVYTWNDDGIDNGHVYCNSAGFQKKKRKILFGYFGDNVMDRIASRFLPSIPLSSNMSRQMSMEEEAAKGRRRKQKFPQKLDLHPFHPS